MSSLVSVLMPTYNSEKFVAESIGSVLSQADVDLELIVVDDASRDDTFEYVMSLDDPRIRAVRNPVNLGPGETRNLALELSRGDYIAFIDSDDVWRSDKLARQMERMGDTGAAFTYTNYRVIDEQGNEITNSGRLPARATYESLLPYCFIRMSSVVYDSRRTRGKHLFPDLRKRQDFCMFLSLLKTVDAELVDDFLCSYRLADGSVSSKKLANIPYQWSVYRGIEGLSAGRSARLIAEWMVRAGGTHMRRRVSALVLTGRESA